MLAGKAADTMTPAMTAEPDKTTDPEASVKLTAYLAEKFRRAINLFAAGHGWTVGQAVAWLVEQGIPDDLQRAEALIREGIPNPKGTPGPKPRKPKPAPPPRD